MWWSHRAATYQRRRGTGMEVMYYKYEEMYNAVNLKKPGISKKAQALWALRNGDEKAKATLTQAENVKLRVEPQCDKHCGRRT